MDAALLTVVLIASVVVHEVAHAWQARREGDYTAERLGRITLNPLPHLDPIGSFLIPLALHFSGSSFLFGWAKPVPVNPGNYRNPVAGDIRVSLAGIVSNLALAALATVGVIAVLKLEAVLGPLGGVTETLRRMALYGILINLVLAVFNLIPIPPLDGSHVLAHLLPPAMAAGYRSAGRYGFLILMALFFLAPGTFEILMWPVSALMGVADAFIRLWT